MIEIAFSLNQLEEVVKKHIFNQIRPGVVFLISGPLGAGKTTMAKKIGQILGVEEIITSPTFTYVSSYRCFNNPFGIKNFVHFDLYRIGTIDELINLDLVGYFSDLGNFCFVEWPEVLEQNLEIVDVQVKLVKLKISHDQKNPKLRRLKIDF